MIALSGYRSSIKTWSVTDLNWVHFGIRYDVVEETHYFSDNGISIDIFDVDIIYFYVWFDRDSIVSDEVQQGSERLLLGEPCNEEGDRGGHAGGSDTHIWSSRSRSSFKVRDGSIRYQTSLKISNITYGDLIQVEQHQSRYNASKAGRSHWCNVSIIDELLELRLHFVCSDFNKSRRSHQAS